MTTKIWSASSHRCLNTVAHAVKRPRPASHAKSPLSTPLSDEALVSGETIIQPYANPSIAILDLRDKGKGLVALSDIAMSSLLLISRPAVTITGPPGAHLETDDLAQAIMDSSKKRLALSFLFDGSTTRNNESMPSLTQMAHLDDSSEALATDLDVRALVRYNAFGEPYGDPAAWSTRGQGQDFCSFLGLWPAFALINHSCRPNASTMVLSSKEELMMLVRAGREIKAGEEISIAYSDVCKPLAERRSHLMAVYGFECRCGRCQREEEIALAEPEMIRHLLTAHEELIGPLTDATHEALTPVDDDEDLEEMDPNQYVTIERETVSKIKAIILSSHAAIWSLMGEDRDSYLSSWQYKAYELLSMICVGNEIQVPFHPSKENEKGPREGKGKVQESRTGLGGLRRRLALLSRSDDSAASRAVKAAYALHLDLLESIRARHHLLQSIAPGSYQEAALGARRMKLTRELYGLTSAEAQKAMEKCLGSTQARYGILQATMVAKLVSAHEDNDLELSDEI